MMYDERDNDTFGMSSGARPWRQNDNTQVEATAEDDKIFVVNRDPNYTLAPNNKITACAFSNSIFVVGMNSGALNYFNVKTGEMVGCM